MDHCLIVAVAAAAALATPGVVAAQAARDSADADGPARPVHEMDELVVVAHRTETRVRESVAATTVLDRSAIRQLPARNLPELLRHVPGLLLVDRDGSRERSMAIARGFFGGGETEYVLVTVDDVPLNDLRTGGVDWTQVPVSAIERIEVLRGAGSIAYGDAAIGAVINLVTRSAAERATGGDPGSPAFSGHAIVGAWEDLALRARAEVPIGRHGLTVATRADRGSGYREHASTTDFSASATYRPPWRDTDAYVDAEVQRIETEDPGPLTSSAAEDDPRRANPLFAGDERLRRHLRLGAGLDRDLGSNGRLGGDARLQFVGFDETSTLLLAPSFGDTQLHEEDDLTLWTRVQGDRRTDVSSLVAGVELERGTYGSRYLDPSDRARPLTESSGRRTKIGIYGEVQRRLTARLRVYAGLRYDGIAVERESASSAWFNQWSPRIGVNVAYLAQESRSGNLYATWTRAFKAPTLAQLYDEREIPTGVPGETIVLSNPELVPQRSTGVEVGIYQKLPLTGERVRGELAVSVYRMDLDDEIDFDLRTFRYGNIQKSRHDGIELSLTTHLLERLALTHSSTWMDVSFRSGEHEGNRLKNIPGRSMANTARLRIAEAVRASLSHHFADAVYLSDENARALPGGSTFDAAVEWELGGARLQLAAINLLDASVSRAGFLLFDPVSSSQIPYEYPAGGRYLRATVSIGS